MRWPCRRHRRRGARVGRAERGSVADRAADRRLPAARAERRRRAQPADRVPRRLRRVDAVREGARLRYRARTSIVTYLTRRDSDSPGDWLRVIIDSYHDKRTAYEFGVNPSGVKLGSVLVQRQQPRRQLGRGVGRQRLARCAGLVGRIPDSVLAAALQPVADEHVRPGRVARHRPAEGNHRPGRCCRAAPTATCRRSASWAACR